MFREYADEWVTSAKTAGGEWVSSSKAADEPPLADGAAGGAAGEEQQAGGRGAVGAKPASDTALARGLRALESRSLFERLQVPLSLPFQACPRLPATVVSYFTCSLSRTTTPWRTRARARRTSARSLRPSSTMRPAPATDGSAASRVVFCQEEF